MRLIDADAFRDWWLYNGENEHIYDTNDILDSIDNWPTFTPSNEPLTWSELAEMEDQPVYIVEMGVRRYWALVTHVGKDAADFVTADYPDDYGGRGLYGETWVVYRRPPEGEGEANG